MYFTKDGFLINITQSHIEPYEHYLERVNFVLCQQPKTTDEFTKAETFSYIYINKKYSGAEYSQNIEKQLENMCTNLFKN